MGHGGHDFAAAGGGEVGEKRGTYLTSYVSERVTIEEKERSVPVALPEEI